MQTHTINKVFEVTSIGFIPWIPGNDGSIVALLPTFSGGSNVRDEGVERGGGLLFMEDEKY